MREDNEAMRGQLLAYVTVYADTEGDPSPGELAAVGELGKPVDQALAIGARLAYELLGTIAAAARAMGEEHLEEDEVWRRLMLERAQRKTTG